MPIALIVDIVDDDAVVRETLECYCRHVGYTVRLAADGVSAIEQCLADPPDALLLDLELPKMHGLEVLRQVRRARPEVAVIIVSGALDGATRETAARLGARACLQKPFKLEDLGILLARTLLISSAADTAAVWRHAPLPKETALI